VKWFNVVRPDSNVTLFEIPDGASNLVVWKIVAGVKREVNSGKIVPYDQYMNNMTNHTNLK